MVKADSPPREGEPRRRFASSPCRERATRPSVRIAGRTIPQKARLFEMRERERNAVPREEQRSILETRPEFQLPARSAAPQARGSARMANGLDALQ